MPKVRFEYSSIYDAMIHQWKGQEFNDASGSAAEFLKEVEPLWRAIEAPVFRVMEEKTGLTWKEQSINAFLVQNSKPISRPLTLPMTKRGDEFLETLMHELAHNLLVQNRERMRKVDYGGKYGDINRTVYIHIRVHAILKVLYDELFGEEKTMKFIRLYDVHPDYKRAWEIVENEGAEKVVREHFGGPGSEK